ncbi:uncharacterized protein LOC144110229 [Amblyomma americanum]
MREVGTSTKTHSLPMFRPWIVATRPGLLRPSIRSLGRVRSVHQSTSPTAMKAYLILGLTVLGHLCQIQAAALKEQENATGEVQKPLKKFSVHITRLQEDSSNVGNPPKTVFNIVDDETDEQVSASVSASVSVSIDF